MKRLSQGQVVDLHLPAALIISAARLPADVRVTAMILTFDRSGRHRDNVGTAADVSHHTSSAELQLEDPAPGDKQVLLITGTRNGKEVPFGELPTLRFVVNDGTTSYSWDSEPSPNKSTILLETYRREDKRRLRVVAQGYVDGWTAFCEKTGCTLALQEILAATQEEASGPAHDPQQHQSGSSLDDLRAEERRLQASVHALQSQLTGLRSEYANKKSIYDTLLERVQYLQEMPEWAQFAEVGIYRPHFDYDTSDAYKAAITKVRTDQREMVKRGAAVSSQQEWTVGGDRRAGAEMIKRQINLTLRAFNGEADAAIAAARWNNMTTMEGRIRKSAETINKANQSLKVSISPAYLDLKIRELRLVHEYRDKLHEEREEQAELRRAQKEQERLERDVAKAEREEQKFQLLLDRARAEAAAGDQTQSLKDRIARLEADLANASSEKDRTKAMAEMTKCGFVYVISNVGSFGEGIVKIGMTRRVDPLDRIRELSSASVPFAFDTHLLFHSVVASELEADLHRAFAERRVNMSNNRKEFFQCSIGEVEETVKRIIPNATFTRDPEAREWRETVISRKQRLASLAGGRAQAFPDAL